MIVKKCLRCGVKFKVKPYRKDIAKFCSRKCWAKGQIPWNKDKVGVYSKETLIKMKKAKQGKYGKDTSRWKGGRQKTKNRLYIYFPHHPFSNSRGCVLQSRLIAEKYLDRYLTRKEIIHHINSDTLDDQSENLYLFPSQSEHMRFHRLKVKQTLISNLISKNYEK